MTTMDGKCEIHGKKVFMCVKCAKHAAQLEEVFMCVKCAKHAAQLGLGATYDIAFKKGQASLIEELGEKMGQLSLSGGSYGQLDGEETEPTRTISVVDWEKIKKLAQNKEGK